MRTVKENCGPHLIAANITNIYAENVRCTHSEDLLLVNVSLPFAYASPRGTRTCGKLYENDAKKGQAVA